MLVPDFQGRESSIATVLEAEPDIYNHNTETVPRLYKKCRPGGRYERVMDIFPTSKRLAPNIPTKTGMILGMGETIEEVVAVMRDLRDVDVDILTLGQYLRPSADHIPLDRYVTPAEFAHLRGAGMAMGFRHVESGPLVRSSYHAWEQVQAAGGRSLTPTSTMAKKKTDSAGTSSPSDRDLNLELLRSMLLQRRFEERTAEAYALGKIGGFCHLYIGQEAVSTGTLSVLRPDDYVITTYRDHGQALARGMTPRGR